MQKSGGAVIPMKDNKILELAGGWNGEEICGGEPFSPLVMEFLQELSKEILRSPLARRSDDLTAFAFWCRKNQLNHWKQVFEADSLTRVGYGMIFHIAPSNIPALFAYSMVYGMLAGNGNLIRISQRILEEAMPLCQIIDQVMKQEKYESLYKSNKIISYERDDEITLAYSKQCDGRILWGGDQVIRHLRGLCDLGGKPELVFPDRYSMVVLDGPWMREQDADSLKNLAHRFYNDTYLMDQNECSSPKIIFWTPETKKADQEIWWDALEEKAKEYDLTAWKVMRKYEDLCRTLMTADAKMELKCRGNLIYMMNCTELSADARQYDGKYGTFYQYQLKNLDELGKYLNRKVQTILYAGVKPEQIRDVICKTGAKGGDRIVPVGQALQLSYIWDGKNVLHQLSRIIDCQ